VTIFDEPRYPFDLPEGQQLYYTLINLFPATQGAILVARSAGLDTSLILEQQAVAHLWKDIVEAASTAHRLRRLVQYVHDRQLNDHPARPFLADLLAGRPVAVSADARGPDTPAGFLHDDDTVGDLEARLFGDDLTISVGVVPRLIATLERMVTVAPAVCKLTVTFDTRRVTGTGFRVAADLLLTNWHVVRRRDSPARTVAAEFGFEDDDAGTPLAATGLRCDAELVGGHEGDDWALLRTLDPMSDAWPVIRLSEAATPVAGHGAFVVQHPNGDRKRLGFVRNPISYVDERVVHYLTDTTGGSSGAPVLDESGRLIALHHRGGRPQETMGGVPVRKNEGIRISRVAAAITSAGIAVD
jgi:hypothetical protein